MKKDQAAPAQAGEGVVEQVEQKVSAIEAAVLRGIEAWAVQHLHNSVFSRATEEWNHFRAGIGKLAASIVVEIEGGDGK